MHSWHIKNYVVEHYMCTKDTLISEGENMQIQSHWNL